MRPRALLYNQETMGINSARTIDVTRQLVNNDDDNDEDDVHLYSAECYCSMLGAIGRIVSFEACCQWALLSAQITRYYSTI